jgi:hypothetical protein
VRVDQLPVEATVAPLDDLEVGIHAPVIAPDQRIFSLLVTFLNVGTAKGFFA